MFKDVLQEVVENTRGATAGLIMGYDGILLETYVSDDATTSIETVGMEYSVVLTQIQQAAEMLEVGAAQEVALQAEGMTTVVHLLNQEYFVAVTLQPGGNSGKARYLLRTKAPALLEHL